MSASPARLNAAKRAGAADIMNGHCLSGGQVPQDVAEAALFLASADVLLITCDECFVTQGSF